MNEHVPAPDQIDRATGIGQLLGDAFVDADPGGDFRLLDRERGEVAGRVVQMTADRLDPPAPGTRSDATARKRSDPRRATGFPIR
jgi:hypothetical protein